MDEIIYGSSDYYREIFDRVLLCPCEFAGCLKTWRLAASLARCDVVRALLGVSTNQECMDHALRWAAPEVSGMLNAHKEALMIENECYAVSSDQQPRRI